MPLGDVQREVGRWGVGRYTAETSFFDPNASAGPQETLVSLHKEFQIPNVVYVSIPPRRLVKLSSAVQNCSSSDRILRMFTTSRPLRYFTHAHTRRDQDYGVVRQYFNGKKYFAFIQRTSCISSLSISSIAAGRTRTKIK